MTPTMISTTETFFQSNMDAAYPAIPVAYSGQNSPDEPLYVRFWVIASNETFPAGMGLTAKSRNVGIIQIDVMGPKDGGAGQTGDLIWEMSNWFKRQQMNAGTEGAITFKEPTIKDWGPAGEQHRQTGSIPYVYDFSS